MEMSALGAVPPGRMFIRPRSATGDLVFFHIPKTGGTSLRKTLGEAFGAEACSGEFAQSYMTPEEAAALKKRKFICGHISRTDHLKYFRDRQVFTVLRQPIDRCLSWIRYVRSLALNELSAPIVVAAHNTPDDLDLIEHPEAQINLRNAMTRQLGGHLCDIPRDMEGTLANAKVTLHQCVWIGRREAFTRDIPDFAAVLGRPLAMQVSNVTPRRPKLADEGVKLLRRLEELNEFDCHLWNWVHWEIFHGKSHCYTIATEPKHTVSKRKAKAPRRHASTKAGVRPHKAVEKSRVPLD